MVLFGVWMLINIFDMFIYRRYLEVFLGKRRTSTEFSIILMMLCVIVGSMANSMHISWLNLLVYVVILSAYICQYSAGTLGRIAAVMMYMGLMVIAEPVGYMAYRIFAEDVLKEESTAYFFVAFVMGLFRMIVVEGFCRAKTDKHLKVSLMPQKVVCTLLLIPSASLISCFLLIEVAKEVFSAQTAVLCMSIIFTIIVTNYLVFRLIEQYTIMAQKQHEEDMVQREVEYRNEYYRDVEQYQDEIQNMKHDMKNRLTVLLDAAHGENRAITERLQEMMGDIQLAEEILYSANPALNSIIKRKVAKAKEYGIRTDVCVLVPKKMAVEIGDMGVLYGNLLDNAIEACLRVDQTERFIELNTRYQDGRLLLKVRNSKSNTMNAGLITEKKDKRFHGRGIRSVRKVAEQYGGNLVLNDKGDVFEAVLLLTGVGRLE